MLFGCVFYIFTGFFIPFPQAQDVLILIFAAGIVKVVFEIGKLYLYCRGI